jgi:hypothetical protein
MGSICENVFETNQNNCLRSGKTENKFRDVNKDFIKGLYSGAKEDFFPKNNTNGVLAMNSSETPAKGLIKNSKSLIMKSKDREISEFSNEKRTQRNNSQKAKHGYHNQNNTKTEIKPSYSNNNIKKRTQNCLETTKHCKSPRSDYFSNLSKECFLSEKDKFNKKSRSRLGIGHDSKKDIQSTLTFCTNEKFKRILKKKKTEQNITAVGNSHLKTKSPDHNPKKLGIEYTDKKTEAPRKRPKNLSTEKNVLKFLNKKHSASNNLISGTGNHPNTTSGNQTNTLYGNKDLSTLNNNKSNNMYPFCQLKKIARGLNPMRT